MKSSLVLVSSGTERWHAGVMSELQYIQPDGHFVIPSYTHVVLRSRPRTVYVSGQVASDHDGNTVGVGDYAAQTEQAYENLRAALAAAGATFADVTKMTVYVVGLTPDVRSEIGVIRAHFMPANPPASTLVGVSALAMPDWLIEVEAIATLD
jgi:enamine deaminase RidA (YjgF/YER057c/UK114 family)